MIFGDGFSPDAVSGPDTVGVTVITKGGEDDLASGIALNTNDPETTALTIAFTIITLANRSEGSLAAITRRLLDGTVPQARAFISREDWNSSDASTTAGAMRKILAT